jgi:hypothetical protein
MNSIDKNTAGLNWVNGGKPDVLVENGASIIEPICGKLEFDHYEPAPDRTYYKIIADGCITVYLTDCHGSMTSSIQYMCVAGQQLYIDGCHAFGCDC